MPKSWTTSPRQHPQRYPHQADFDVDSSSESPSDDEHADGVATRVRPILQRKTSGKVDRARNPVTYRDYTASRYSPKSKRSNLQRQSTRDRLSPPRAEECGEVYVTTMDEDDQQMFIALFYWRRKVIETHFSTWKWVALGLRRSAKQIHRHTRPRKPLSTSYDLGGLPPPRRNLILKHHTGRSSAEETENNRSNNLSSPEHLKASPPTKLTQDGIDEHNVKRSNNSTTKELPFDTHSEEKRRRFKTELRSIYCCFSQWKCNVDQSRKKRVLQLVQVTDFRRQKQLRTFIRAWKNGSDTYKLKRQRLEGADGFHRAALKQHVFFEWKRHCRVECEIRRREDTRADQLKFNAFHHWHRCILQTRKCWDFTAKRNRRHLHLVLRYLQEGVGHAKQERWKCDDAISHYRSNLQLSVLRTWRANVFEDPLYLQSIDHEKRISLSSGVRKWRRFITRREERARQVLLADFYRYRSVLLRAVRGWGQFLEWKRHHKELFVEARRHYELNVKRIGIQAFRSAVIVNQTRRGQVRAATRWHQHKLSIRVFELWAITAQKSLRLKTFQRSIDARRLSGVVRGWRNQTAVSKRLGAIQSLVSKRWDGLLLQACMAKWVRWLDVKSMISSCELKRRNRSIANHFRAWHDWSRTKVSWWNTVEQQRLRHDTALLQRVVSKWLGVTLRKRCFNRLVKLFRKKQSRHRVKSIFQLWRVDAHICKATRKLDQELTRLSLVEWKRICRERKEERCAMSMATQFYCERRYVVAIEQWSAFAQRRAGSRKADSQALSHYFRRISIRALQCWYVAARELRRQSELFRYRQHLRDKKSITRCLHAWYQLVRRWADHRAKEWAALQFQVQSLQRRSFYAWFEFLETRRASNERKYCAVTSYENSLQVNILRLWHLETRRSAQHRLNSSSLRNTLMQRRLQARVTHWSDFCRERRRRRQQVATADKFYNEYVVCLAMFHWQGMWLKSSALRVKEARVVRQLNSRRLSKAVYQWYENYRHSSDSRSKKAKASRLYSRHLLTQSFRVWKEYNDAARQKVSKRRFIAHLRQREVLAKMFQRWRSFSECSAFERRQLRLALDHRSRVILRLVFQNWKCYRSRRTLYINAYMFRRKLLLRKVWIGWKQHCEYVAKVRHNILVTNQLLRSNLFRATFVQWKAYIAQHQERQDQLHRADDHYVQYLCRRAVARLRKQAKFQQSVVKAAMFSRVNGARYLWRRWKYFVGIKRMQRGRRSLAKQTYIHKHQRRHFLAWKSHTKRCVQGRMTKSDALYRVSCLRMVWSRWGRVLTWRRCITTMGYRRVEYLQAATLRIWHVHVSERIDQRAKVARAIDFQECKIREKSWKAWQLYITYRHEKQEQRVWIRSYFSVQVLLRKSFVSWKRLVSIEQRKSDNKELADTFNLHRLAHMGFRKWKTFTELRKVKLVRKEAQLRKSERLGLSRTLRKWRNLAVVWGRQHQNKVRATQFYSRRRLLHGLDKLRYWRVVQKTTSDRIIRAERFRGDKTLVACFQHWQRYHQWRARYAHLALAFKRNQKEDAFIRWKTFWQQRQSMNEKRLKARVFHCVHVEQTALTTWRAVVREREQSKVARAFNTAKVLRKTFTLWNRKAHVLRQMRKMFLYQERFRAQTHFDAWKRYVSARKQRNENLRGATRFRDNRIKSDVWQKWNTWVSTQRQERDTIQLAVVFRQRFSTRKSFALWKGRCQYWKRRSVLADQALLHYHSSIMHRCFHALVARRQSTAQLFQRQTALKAQLVQRRKLRVIATLRALCAESDRKRSLIKRACSHWQLCHQQKYWGRVMQWFDVAKYRKLQRTQADAFARSHLLSRCISALQLHINHTKQLKIKVEAFRCRYFRSVADECFYQWKAFTAFKQKLRVLRQKTRQSQRRHRLQQWRRITVEQARRRAGMQLITAKRRRCDLMAWFNHWESVCTDQWINTELVAHHRRHAHKQRLLRSAVAAFKTRLAARRQRHKYRSFFLQHHKTFLVQTLQRWRHATDHQKGNFNM